MVALRGTVPCKGQHRTMLWEKVLCREYFVLLWNNIVLCCEMFELLYKFLVVVIKVVVRKSVVS